MTPPERAVPIAGNLVACPDVKDLVALEDCRRCPQWRGICWGPGTRYVWCADHVADTSNMMENSNASTPTVPERCR